MDNMVANGKLECQRDVKSAYGSINYRISTLPRKTKHTEFVTNYRNLPSFEQLSKVFRIYARLECRKPLCTGMLAAE